MEELKEKSEKSNRITQKYDYAILDDKKAFNKKEMLKTRKKTQPLEYKEMNYLQDEPNESESAIFRDREIQMHKKKKETAI